VDGTDFDPIDEYVLVRFSWIDELLKPKTFEAAAFEALLVGITGYVVLTHVLTRFHVAEYEDNDYTCISVATTSEDTRVFKDGKYLCEWCSSLNPFKGEVLKEPPRRTIRETEHHVQITYRL
jgi:hypothetical protein